MSGTSHPIQSWNRLTRGNRMLSVALLVLVSLSIVLYRGGQTRREGDPELFRIPEGRTVDRISLTSVNDSVRIHVGPTVTDWTIGDSVAVDPQRVQLLVATLDRLRPGRTAGPGLRDSLMSEAKRTGVGLFFYQKEELVAHWYALGNGNETWFLSADGSEVRRMTIPGYRSEVMKVLSLSPDDWRERRLFDFNWRNFTGFTARFPEHPERDFSVSRRDDMFVVSELVRTDTASLNTFLDAVSLMEAERVESPGPVEWSSLAGQDRELIWTVTEVSGAVRRVHVLRSGLMLSEPRPGRFFKVDFQSSTRRMFQAVRADFMPSSGVPD